jgi:hypothetical protein
MLAFAVVGARDLLGVGESLLIMAAVPVLPSMLAVSVTLRPVHLVKNQPGPSRN